MLHQKIFATGSRSMYMSKCIILTSTSNCGFKKYLGTASIGLTKSTIKARSTSAPKSVKDIMTHDKKRSRASHDDSKSKRKKTSKKAISAGFSVANIFHHCSALSIPALGGGLLLVWGLSSEVSQSSLEESSAV